MSPEADPFVVRDAYHSTMVFHRRARLLRLTAKGKRLLAASRPVVEALQSDILAPLSAGERRQFLASAQKALGLARGARPPHSNRTMQP